MVTMDPYTTESPPLIIFDDDEPVPPSRTVNHGKLAAHTIYVIFAVISSLCVLITVIRTKSVRNQLIVVMLVNLAVVLLLHGVIDTRTMETESRGGIGNFGTMGCQFYIIGLKVSNVVMHASIVIICLDVTFSLPQPERHKLLQQYAFGGLPSYLHC